MRSTLEMLGAPHQYEAGQLTPIGLFERIAEHPDKILVLDDVSSIFDSSTAVQLLLAALGNQPGGPRVRYKTARDAREVNFTGGIIAISNLPLTGHHPQMLQALQDRIHVICYEPTDEQIISLMRHVAEIVGNVRVDGARSVLEFLLAECQRRKIPPSLRLFVDKAIPDFLMHQARECELDWRDLIVSDLEQQLIHPIHPATDLSRADQLAAERRLIEELRWRFQAPAERLQEWMRRTGKSQAAFYRRMKEIKSKLDAA